MYLKLNNFFLVIFIFSINLEAKLNKAEENFVDVFYRYGECNNSYNNFVNSDKKIKKYLSNKETKDDFELQNLSEFDLNFYKKKIRSHCNPSEIFNDATLDLEKLLSSNSVNKGFLLALHLHNLVKAIALSNPNDTEEIYDVLSNTFSSVSRNFASLNTNNNWTLSILNLYNLVDAGSLTEYADNYDGNYRNQNYHNYLLYNSLESIILQSINPSLSEESINLIAKVLMQTRIKKIQENKWFGTSADDYLLREEFLNLYLKKYEDKKIKYTEFSNIFFDNFSDSTIPIFIELDIDLDALEDLIRLSIDKSTTLLTSNSEIQYVQRIIDIASDKFYENPKRIISMTYYSLNMLSNNTINTCSFKDKQIEKINNIEYYLLVTKLNYFKFACTQDLELYKTILGDFNKGLSFIKKNSVDITSNSIHDEYIIELLALMTASFTLIDSSDLRVRISEINFNNFIRILYEAINKYKSTTINNTDGLLYISMFMNYELMLDIFYSEDLSYKNKIDKYKETVLTKFPLDFKTVKSEFNQSIKNFDSDDMNNIFMTARFAQFIPSTFINNYYDEKTSFWPEKIVKDLSQFEIEDSDYKNLIQSLDLLSHVIDSLHEMFKGPDYFLFIFKDQSLISGNYIEN
ncbi:hypothetical protein N8874_00020 [Gammaproteobacteria bacterium]|nr:hypothetical protein [Gammaproteobacteria bacterium]